MLDKNATYEEARQVALAGPWQDIRFRRSSTKEGWVLKYVHQNILDRVKVGLFDHGCRQLSPVHQQDSEGIYNALHFKADKHTIGNLAAIFACEPGDTPIKINSNGDALFGAVAKVALFAQKQQILATSETVLAVTQRHALKNAAADTATDQTTLITHRQATQR